VDRMLHDEDLTDAHVDRMLDRRRMLAIDGHRCELGLSELENVSEIENVHGEAALKA